MEALNSHLRGTNTLDSSSVQDLGASPAKCHFYWLPSELKQHVVSYVSDFRKAYASADFWKLDQKRDLYNLSRTCQWLEDVVLNRLYSVVDVEIPTEKSSAWSTGSYLKLRTHVIQEIQELKIRDGGPNHTQPQFHKRRRSDAGSPESWAAQILEKMPRKKLKSLS